MRRARATAAIAATAALALAGCGNAHSHGAGCSGQTTGPTTTGAGSAAQLAVSPAQPTTADPITFAFTAPQASGVHGKFRIGYSVSITGPAGNGCVGAHEANVSQAGQGGRASVTVGPAQLGHPWCAGAYTARAFELESAACTGSRPCPQFIRVVGIVARASFSVRAA